MVWGSPREQFGDFDCPHLYTEALHVPWPVRKWFNSDHRWGPQLLRSWLLKLIASPLSTMSACLQESC